MHRCTQVFVKFRNMRNQLSVYIEILKTDHFFFKAIFLRKKNKNYFVQFKGISQMSNQS